MASPAIYLDYAAATPVEPTVLDAMLPYLSDFYYNPSAQYSRAQQTHAVLETARKQVAHLLGARPSEIIFTAGGTEANNLAIHGVMRNYPGTNVVVSAIEHDAVLVPADTYDRREAAVTPQGTVDLAHLQSQIDDHTVLVSIMYANNEIGTIQPLSDVAQIIIDVRRTRQKQGNTLPLYFHSDACQAGNYLDLHVSRLGVDMLTLNGGKLYGPKQSGALYLKGGIQLVPLIHGGGQERGLRSGTENVANAVGLSAALTMAQAMRHTEIKRLQTLQQQFYKLLTNQIAQAVVNGSLKRRLPNNVHITIPGFDNERLLMQLDAKGIMAAAGSACSASSDEPSHVLKALGKTDAEARASLRFTMGRTTTESDITICVQTLAGLLS